MTLPANKLTNVRRRAETRMIEALERAAEICEEHSRTIRGDFYDTFIRRWYSQDMKAKHWECVALAKRLRKIAAKVEK